MKVGADRPDVVTEFVVSGKKILLMIDQFSGKLHVSFPHGKGRFGADNIAKIDDPASVDHVEFHGIELVQVGSALLIRPNKNENRTTKVEAEGSEKV